MKIGIRNGSLGMDMLQAVEAGAELGYDGVELDIPADYGSAMIWDAEGRRQLSEAAKSSGCEVCSLCLGAFWQISPASPDEQVRAEARELTAASAAFAAELGAQWMLLPVTPGCEDQCHEECTQRWIEEVRKVAPVAEDLGVHYCLENVGRGCGKSADDLLGLVAGTNSPAVGVYYDIGNAIAFGYDPVDEIKRLAEVLRIVHVKDRDGERLGDGVVPIAECMKALAQIGYNGYLVLETPPTDDAMRAGAYNLDFLRRLLDNL